MDDYEQNMIDDDDGRMREDGAQTLKRSFNLKSHLETAQSSEPQSLGSREHIVRFRIVFATGNCNPNTCLINWRYRMGLKFEMTATLALGKI